MIALDATGNIYLLNINQVRHLLIKSTFLKPFIFVEIRKRYASDIPSNRIIEWKHDLKLVYQKKLLPNPKYVLVSDLRKFKNKKI